MFKREQVNKVIDELKKDFGYFVSEAHFQMSFAFKAHELFKDEGFKFIPEYSIMDGGEDKRDEIDLVVVDKKNNNETTFIEFKHKTKNGSGNNLLSLPIYGKNNEQFEPKKHAAQNLGRYDCWHDIARIEKFVIEKKANNGFFIFLTNDALYWEDDGSGKNNDSIFGSNFNIMAGKYGPNSVMKWPDEVIDKHIESIGQIRKNPIKLEREKNIKYDIYKEVISKRNGEFRIAIVDID